MNLESPTRKQRREVADMATAKPGPAVIAGAELKRTYSSFPSGVTAVCALIDGTTVGMAVSAFTSVSLEPPLLSICIREESSTWLRLREARHLGLSVLAESQADTGRQLSRDGDRFAGLGWEATSEGAVLLDGSAARFECSVRDEIPAGDHLVVLLAIHQVWGGPDSPPLVFHGSRFHGLRGIENQGA